MDAAATAASRPDAAMVPVGSPPTGTISTFAGDMNGDPNADPRPLRTALHFVTPSA